MIIKVNTRFLFQIVIQVQCQKGVVFLLGNYKYNLHILVNLLHRNILEKILTKSK